MYYFATKHGRELHQLFDSVCRGTEVGENNYVEPAELGKTELDREYLGGVLKEVNKKWIKKSLLRSYPKEDHNALRRPFDTENHESPMEMNNFFFFQSRSHATTVSQPTRERSNQAQRFQKSLAANEPAEKDKKASSTKSEWARGEKKAQIRREKRFQI